MNDMKQTLIYILIGISCSSLGFGVSQLTIVGQVKENHSTNVYLLDSLRQERQDRKDADDSLKLQLASILNAEQAQIEQTGQLISLVRVQNQVLNSK